MEDILGHGTYATTMDWYVHTIPSSLSDAMERGAGSTGDFARWNLHRLSPISSFANEIPVMLTPGKSDGREAQRRLVAIF